MSHRFAIIIPTSLVLFLLDRALKFWARFGIPDNSANKIISFTYIKNVAGPFSLPVANWLVMIIGFLVLILVVILMRQVYIKKDWIKFLGFSLIIIGGVSNILDRIFGGGVVDVFKTMWQGVFNLADVYLLCGLLLIISQSKIINK